MVKRLFAVILLLTGFLSLSSTAAPTLTEKMQLSAMCSQADKIFRGQVVDIVKGEVEVAGTSLPTITYKLSVQETFKGQFVTSESGEKFVEITSIGESFGQTAGSVSRFNSLPEVPKLAINEDYLLLTTAPSAIGLSTMVGLGQGMFSIAEDKAETVANALNNQALSAEIDGPVSYQVMAEKIRQAVAQ